ncbi:hypothetical protein BD413DRAFT_645501 [Trametes elegans]|nr:hypothetical protein BD413DRAFT_645501 [Trametes elegans]
MRLLNSETGRHANFNKHKDVSYAVFSHVWDSAGEQTYQQLLAIQNFILESGGACSVARADGYRYLWMDSNCIKKGSSEELSEAINSTMCYAFLADVDDDSELIAPVVLTFLSSQWTVLGSSAGWRLRCRGRPALTRAFSSTVDSVSVARRMWWASSCTTSRTEDEVYCLRIYSTY